MREHGPEVRILASGSGGREFKYGPDHGNFIEQEIIPILLHHIVVFSPTIEILSTANFVERNLDILATSIWVAIHPGAVVIVVTSFNGRSEKTRLAGKS